MRILLIWSYRSSWKICAHHERFLLIWSYCSSRKVQIHITHMIVSLIMKGLCSSWEVHAHMIVLLIIRGSCSYCSYCSSWEVQAHITNTIISLIMRGSCSYHSCDCIAHHERFMLISLIWWDRSYFGMRGSCSYRSRKNIQEVVAHIKPALTLVSVLYRPFCLPFLTKVVF